MAKNQRISDGQTLVSSGGNFVLGFFSPSNSKHRYVGIWYGKVSVKTIIWVANRERPLAEPTGALALNNDGSLVVMDWRGGFIPIAFGSDRSVNTRAKLLDNGNLILSEGNGSNDGRIVWQSFDYPTDTFLPGMKAGLNLRTKQNRVLISWRSEEDPAPGVYSFGSDPNGSAKFFIWQDGTIYWVCWTFSKNSFEFKSGPKYHFNYSFETDGDEQYFSYSLSNKSVISRLLLDPYGQIKQYVWSEDVEKWNVLWSFPTDRCDVYAPCGANGICNTNSSTLCKCPQGFEPVSPKAWASNSWSDGCQRREKLKCGKTAGFLQLKNTKFPDQMRLVAGIGHDIRVCEAACRANCSCVAYSSANTSGCLFWSGDLMGLRENYSGVYGEPDIFIRVAASVLVNAKEKELLQLQIATGITAASKFNNKSSSLKEGKGYDIKLFSFSSIAAATNNFSEANKLGEGGFGPVYRMFSETDPTKQRTLDWGKRVRIIEGIAQGLLYLHKYSRLRVIHRDLKASNILLDGEMNPKISDFGMARIFGHNESVANTKRIVGT
ncbi:hypothetical protein Syun_018089 [Stephania yunnanensis]|uniref:non-specific serine/threonine protein kinase n=1 Tax=Stephania yunnanensis TaxID=152371 RepID=A0AAP0NUP4_9MAGN